MSNAENGSLPGSSLSPEEKSTLGTALHFIEGATIYFQSALPVVREEDELVTDNGVRDMVVVVRLPLTGFPSIARSDR